VLDERLVHESGRVEVRGTPGVNGSPPKTFETQTGHAAPSEGCVGGSAGCVNGAPFISYCYFDDSEGCRTKGFTRHRWADRARAAATARLMESSHEWPRLNAVEDADGTSIAIRSARVQTSATAAHAQLRRMGAAGASLAGVMRPEPAVRVASSGNRSRGRHRAARRRPPNGPSALTSALGADRPDSVSSPSAQASCANAAGSAGTRDRVVERGKIVDATGHLER